MEKTADVHATTSAPRSAVRRRRKKQRPAQILQAAIHEFAVRGFSGCRVADIAAAADLSKGTVYLYFADKAALFKAVLRETVEPVFDFDSAEKDVAANRRSWVVLLRRLLEHWAETLCKPDIAPLLRVLACDMQATPEVAAHCHERITLRAERLIAQVIACGIRAHQFRALDENLVARALMAPFYLFALWPVDYEPSRLRDDGLALAIKTSIELQIQGLSLPSQEPRLAERAIATVRP